jgi:apolipoprotein N-acyltransferase
LACRYAKAKVGTRKETYMLGFLAFLLLLFWVIAVAAHLFGGIVHIALVLAVILAITHFVRRRPAASMR